MLKKQNRFKNESGYSFIELMVAITVLAVVVMPLLSVLVGGYAVMVSAGRQTVAANLCRDKIEEVKAGGFGYYDSLLDEGGQYWEEENPVSGFSHFRRETSIVKETRVLSSGQEGDFTVNLLVIKVTVYWFHEAVAHSVSLVSELAQR